MLKVVYSSMLVLAIGLSGLTGLSVLCQHEDNSMHVAAVAGLIGDKSCHDSYCDAKDPVEDSTVCMESHDCSHVLLEIGDSRFYSAESSRDLVPLPQLAGCLAWELSVGLPPFSVQQGAVSSRAPPDDAACVHLAIRTTVLRI